MLIFGGGSTLPMSMIVEYGAILKVDFRRLGLSQRKSEFFNTIAAQLTFKRKIRGPRGSFVSCTIRVALLAPDIVEAILQGRQHI